MKYHLNRAIRYTAEQELSSLYSWSLQEFSADGRALSAKLIPWQWSLYFAGTEMTLYRSYEMERSSNGEAKRQVGERIAITIEPDERRLGWVRQTRYSMLGTDRLIKSFTLSVTNSGTTDNQFCTAHGWPRYSTDADESFPAETTDDALWFELSIPDQDFAALRQAIQTNSGNVGVTFAVSGVHGFYAEWAPGISTEEVKILAGVEQPVVVPAEVGQLPRLGIVPKCSLQLTALTKMSPHIVTTNADEKSGTPAIVDKHNQSENRLLASVEAIQVAVNRARLPLWLMFVVTAITLLLTLAQV